MATLTDKPATRARAAAQKKHHKSRPSRKNLASKRAQAKKSRLHLHGKTRGPRISRSRLQTLREDLDSTRNAVTTAFNDFWVIPQHDLRETLAKTQKRIKKAAKVLKSAA
jgi:hypothetical protein